MNTFLNQLNYEIQIFPFYLKITIDLFLLHYFLISIKNVSSLCMQKINFHFFFFHIYMFLQVLIDTAVCYGVAYGGMLLQILHSCVNTRDEHLRLRWRHVWLVYCDNWASIMETSSHAKAVEEHRKRTNLFN